MTGARPRGNNNTLSSVISVPRRLIHRLGIAFTHTKREESRNIKSKEGVGMREGEKERGDVEIGPVSKTKIER